MFEKEAEEYLKKDGTKAEQILNMLNEISPLKIKIKQLPFVLAMLQQVYQDGAEFGYNKANEWHILAEEPDVLPKEGQKVKVLTEDNVIQESTYFYDDYFEGMAFSNVGLVKVLAWKEIVLP